MSAAPSKTDSPEDSGSLFSRLSSHRCPVYCYHTILLLISIALLLPEFRLAESRKAHPETQQILMIPLPPRPLLKVQVPRDQGSKGLGWRCGCDGIDKADSETNSHAVHGVEVDPLAEAV